MSFFKISASNADAGIKTGALISTGSGAVSFLESHTSMITATCALVGAMIAILSFFWKIYLDVKEERRKDARFAMDVIERRTRQKPDTGERRRETDK